MEITLPFHRRPPDRRLVAAAVIATPISGACLGAMFFTFPTGVDEVLSLALFMGMTLFGVFAVFAFAYSRAAAPWFVLLMFGGCGSAALPSGAVNQACDLGSANACYTAGPSRHADGIAVDRRTCEEGAAESCERLLVRDPQNAIRHCET